MVKTSKKVRLGKTSVARLDKFLVPSPGVPIYGFGFISAQMGFDTAPAIPMGYFTKQILLSL